MIQGGIANFEVIAMPFAIGDVRVAERGEWLIDRIVATGSLVIRKIGEDRAGEMAVHRFLSSPYVSVSSISETVAVRTAQHCAGRHIVAVQDSSEINFKDRSARRRGLGAGGNGRDAGFFLHPVIAVDAQDEAVIGLLGAQIWTRGQAKVAPRRDRSITDKESMRWLDGCNSTAELLSEAASVTMIADRESDIYELFSARPARLELIVRSAQDRSLADGGRLFAALTGAGELCRRSIRVAPQRPGDPGRTALLAIKSGSVRIARPNSRKASSGLPDDITLTLVEAVEIDPPSPKQAIVWRLLTTHPATNAEQAETVIDRYRLRWRIEQVFRALKSDGLQLDDTQLADAERLFILAAMGLAGAVRTIQLVDARDGSSRPATDAIDPALMAGLQAISRSKEGATAKQKNPHPPQSLAFVAWVAARLGGWNCYGKPPGPKTMQNGWRELAAMLTGIAIALHDANV